MYRIIRRLQQQKETRELIESSHELLGGTCPVHAAQQAEGNPAATGLEQESEVFREESITSGTHRVRSFGAVQASG